MKNPESRPFKDGATRFLEKVLARRSALLSAALTIWRYGRQNKDLLLQGKAIGSYEVWGEWCRDSLLTLGCQDPIKRISETKKNDPRRKQVTEVFSTWWAAHQSQPVKASELDGSVQAVISPEEKGRRQRVTWFLNRNVGARVGGYVLNQHKDETAARPMACYWLELTEGNAD